MAEQPIKVGIKEIEEVLNWAGGHCRESTTEHEDGTYEEGVSDCLRWLLGEIGTRPDQP